MKFRFAFTVFLSIVCNFLLFSQNWKGEVSSDWNNEANWSFPPSVNSVIIIDPINYAGNSFHPVISSASSFIPSEITVQNGANLTVINELYVSGNVILTGISTSLVIQGGSVQLTGNGDLLIDLGAELVHNDGFVGVSKHLIIANGQMNQASKYTLNAGKLEVNTSLSFESNLGNFSPIFNITAGTLTVNGDITWFGQAPGSGKPSFLVSGGTVNIGNNIKNLPGSTVDLYIQLNPFTKLNMNGSSVEMTHTTDSIVTEKNSQFIFNENSNIDNSGVFFAKSGTVKFNSNTTLQGNGINQFHDVNVSDNGSFNHISPQNLFVSGNLYTVGGFYHNNNTLVINGNSTQVWSGNTSILLNNLTMNNVSPTQFAAILFQNPVTLTGHLELIKGYISTSFSLVGPDNLLILTDGATSTSGSPESFVDGPMRKIGNDAFIFPIGTESQLGRLEIAAPTSINSEFTAYYANVSFNNIVDFEAPISSVSNSEYWSLKRENTSDSVVVKLHWNDAAYSHLVNCNELSITNWNGNSWMNQPATVLGDCSGNGIGTLTTNNLQNDFDFFTIAYLGKVSTQNISICDGDTYAIGTEVYDSSGIYTHVYEVSSGEDSTVFTNLTVLQPNVNPFFSELCFGETVNWFGQTFDQAGVYTESYTSYLGCDSIVHLAVFISDEINPTITKNGATFTAEDTSADFYQWINCQTGLEIEFETDPTFTPTENGSYAVRIRKNNVGNFLVTYCEVLSECISIKNVGLNQFETEDIFSIYPNPTTGIFQVNWNTEIPVESIEIFDLQGSLIWKQTEIHGKEITIDLEKVNSGFYILQFKSGTVSTFKFMKK